MRGATDPARKQPPTTTTSAQQCLIIIPRSEAQLYLRVREHFAADTHVFVRMDSRLGDRASRRIEVFAVGGGDLHPSLRTHIAQELRRLRKPPGS